MRTVCGLRAVERLLRPDSRLGLVPFEEEEEAEAREGGDRRLRHVPHGHDRAAPALDRLSDVALDPCQAADPERRLVVGGPVVRPLGPGTLRDRSESATDVCRAPEQSGCEYGCDGDLRTLDEQVLGQRGTPAK